MFKKNSRWAFALNLIWLFFWLCTSGDKSKIHQGHQDLWVAFPVFWGEVCLYLPPIIFSSVVQIQKYLTGTDWIVFSCLLCLWTNLFMYLLTVKVRIPLELMQTEIVMISQRSCCILHGIQLKTHLPVLLRIAFTCIMHRYGFWEVLLFAGGELLERAGLFTFFPYQWCGSCQFTRTPLSTKTLTFF